MSAEPGSTTPSPAQVDRDRLARVQLGRAAGLALLHVSAGLEGSTLVMRGAGTMTMVKVAFAARGRRLLRAAYMLLDNDHAAEAVPLLRTMSEYLIVGRWLALDPDRHLRIWVHDDVRRSLLVDDGAFEHGEIRVMDEQTRQFFEEAKQQLRDQPDEERKTFRLPTIEAMADLVELSFAYDTAYRLDSQSAVHASGMAANNMYDEIREGYLLRAEPHLAFAGIDSYGRGAATLLDLLADAASVIDELGWMPHLELVQKTIAAIAAADPVSATAQAAE